MRTNAALVLIKGHRLVAVRRDIVDVPAVQELIGRLLRAGKLAWVQAGAPNHAVYQAERDFEDIAAQFRAVMPADAEVMEV